MICSSAQLKCKLLDRRIDMLTEVVLSDLRKRYLKDLLNIWQRRLKKLRVK
ncbi:hypothetical protein [Caldiplasma sukawensis]